MLLVRLQFSASLLVLFCGVSLAQEAVDSDSSDLLVPVPVDLIRPVPAPEIVFGELGGGTTLPENLKIRNESGKIEGNREDGIRLGGPVHVTGDNGLEVFSDKATIDLKTKSVIFEGNVSVYQGNILQRGPGAVYFYDEGRLDAPGLRVSLDPILLEAGEFESRDVDGKRMFIGEDSGIAFEDVKDPYLWFRADKTTIYPGERVIFRNLKILAGDTPVFWFPYLSQSLKPELGYHFSPGARSNWGLFLLNTYGVMLGGERNAITGENEDAWLLSRWRFDLRSQRGAAVGLDLVDTRLENDVITGLSFYYAADLNPNDTRSAFVRNNVDPNRYNVELKYRKYFDWEAEAEWRFDADLNLLSDQFYLEDFDIWKYRIDPNPDNTLGLFRRSSDSLFSVHGRVRLNNFYRTDSNLPEIAFDQTRRSIFDSSVLHEGQTSFSIRGAEAGDFQKRSFIRPLLDTAPGTPGEADLLNRLNGYERRLVQEIRALAPGDPRIASLRAQLLDTGFNRFHTNHSFSRPFQYRDWLTFTPHAGAAYTHYSSVRGPEESDDRLMFHGGAELSVKLTKNYSSIENRTFGVDGLLHSFQPYANWSVLAADELNQDYPRIDRLTFTTRPRSLDPQRFTAIDAFESWNILRLGARNHLVTRRDNQSHDWLFIDTYLDMLLDDPEGNQTFSNLFNDIRWQPLPWVSLFLETQIPLLNQGAGFTEFSTRVQFMPHPDFELSFGFRNLNNHPELQDSSRVDLTTYIRLSENWGLGTLHVFEMEDNTLEIQQYSLQRDFGNWVGGVGLSHRNNRFEDEFAIIFSLSLKNFPSVSLPFSLEA